MGGGWNRGLSSARSKLTYKQVQEIRHECAQEGVNIAHLARLYNVSRKTIRDIRDGKSYRWVPDQGELPAELRDQLLDSQVPVWGDGSVPRYFGDDDSRGSESE